MKIAVVFPGYGSQYVGMGKDLYDEYRLVQEYFEEASNCLNLNFVKLCFASSETELTSISNAYPATFLISCSLYALLKQEGLVPSVVAGYNIGEYSALFSSGSITFPDGLYLLNKLASFYQELLPNLDVQMMRVSHIEKQELASLCEHASRGDERALIASQVAPTEFIVSGSSHAVEYVWRKLKEEAALVSVQELSVGFGLHSPLMEPVARNLKIYLEKVDFKDVQIPIISGMDGHFVVSGEEIKRRVIAQITAAINFQRVIEEIRVCELLIAVGPGADMVPILQSYYPDKKCVGFSKKSDLDVIKQIIQTALQETGHDHA